MTEHDLDGGDERLLKELLHAERKLDRSSLDRRTRMLSRLESALLLPPVPPQLPPTQAGAGAAAKWTGTAVSLAKANWGWTVGFIATVGGASALVSSANNAPSTLPHEQSLHASPPASAQPPTHGDTKATHDTEDTEDVALQEPSPSPSAKPTTVTPTPKSEGHATDQSRQNTDPPVPEAALAPSWDAELRRERELLAQARSALDRNEFSAATGLVNLHTSEFPKGRLREEREALRIRILRAAGDRAEAERAADAFAKEFPQSLIGDRVHGSGGPR